MTLKCHVYNDSYEIALIIKSNVRMIVMPKTEKKIKEGVDYEKE